MGATRDDLKGFYIDHEGDGTFTLMYNVSGPRNDDQWESHKINIKMYTEELLSKEMNRIKVIVISNLHSQLSILKKWSENA